MRDKITVKALERWSREAKSSGAKVYVWDTELRGFGAYFSPTSVSWLFQVWEGGRGGKAKRIALGRYPDLDLDEARKQAEGHRKSFNDGVVLLSPRASRLAKERERHASPRLADAIEQYVKLNTKPGRYWPEIDRRLHRDLLGVLGPNIQIADVTKAALRKIIEDTQETRPGAARTLYATLRPFFTWCVQRELISMSPLEKVVSPKVIKARDRVLTDLELKQIWGALNELGWPWGPFHKTLILTAQRREETAGMRWSELDLEKAEWTIPGERTKNGKEHLVHLSPQMMAILQALPRAHDLVFTTTGNTSINGYSNAKEAIDKLVPDIKPWRVHDFRRTAASGMAALGFQPHVIERVLNHISGAQGGLVGVYQKFQYPEDRKRALLCWGGHVDVLVDETRKLSSQGSSHANKDVGRGDK